MTLLVLSFGNWPEYVPVIVSLNILEKYVSKWNHVSMLIIEKSNKLVMNRTINAPRTNLAPSHTEEGDGLFSFSKNESQRSSRARQMGYSKCGRMGHMMMGCGDGIKANEPPGTRYSMVEEGCRPKAVFLTRLESGARNTRKLNAVCELRLSRSPEMLINSGSTEHIVSDFDFFTILKQYESTGIELANGIVVTSSGKGSIVLSTGCESFSH